MSDTAKPPAPLKPETLVLHAGYRSDPATNAVAVPIYQTTSYQFDHTEHASNLFALKELGNIYTRIMNPTTDVLEKRIAAWTAASRLWLSLRVRRLPPWRCRIWRRRATTSSVRPTFMAALGTCSPIRSASRGSRSASWTRAIRKTSASATDERTRAYYAETLPNPKLVVFPIREVADIGSPLGIPLIIDNTAAPLLARPFDHGAAIIVYSTTKFIGGHGTSIGGMIVDSGTFDWAAHAERQPLLNQPDPSYHGAVWVEAVKPIGPVAYIIKARTTLLRDLGAALSPFNAFLTLQGLETLPLRIREHSRNAAAVAEYLSKHSAVTKVIYPGLQDGEARRRADTYLKGGYGGLVGFELKGGRDAGRAFIDALKLVYHVANIGDARTLAIHPASTTHSQLSAEEQFATGVSEGYVRLSVGIEHIDDIIGDLEQALEHAAGLRDAAE